MKVQQESDKSCVNIVDGTWPTSMFSTSTCFNSDLFVQGQLKVKARDGTSS